MRLVRRRHALDLVLRLMVGNILVRDRDFLGSADTKAIVIGVRLVLRVRSAFVNHQAPLGVGMLDYRLLVAALDHLSSQQLGENRQRLIERAALIVPFGHSDRFQHEFLLKYINDVQDIIRKAPYACQLAALANFGIRTSAPDLAHSSSKVLRMIGSSSSYSICQPP